MVFVTGVTVHKRGFC
uniref:Uncharacterized protein n=1 Tax=Arundo donax TaxID=35708 RepID=A0A0A9AED3_ARUDO